MAIVPFAAKGGGNMRTIQTITILAAFILLFTLTSCTARRTDGITFSYKGNPLIRHLYTADPSARVFQDRLYVYTSHDEDDADASQHFYMINWHVFSTVNLTDWTDHGVIFSLDDISWADHQAWAPDCVERDGRYYFYYPVEQTKIGVAVSDTPAGPFVDPLCRPLIDNQGNEAVVGREPIDPAVLIDDNGQAYLYFGCRDARVVKLKDNMIELDGPIQTVRIIGNEGHTEHNDGYYAEAPWVFKRNGLYYLIYSNGWEPQSTIVYAVGNHPLGPFQFIGEVMSAVGAGTSHASIVEFKNKWYIFYHNNSLSKNGKRRSVCFDEITFAQDGQINRLTVTPPEPGFKE
jgi:arabinoxylan arabinofuranohydrolase